MTDLDERLRDLLDRTDLPTSPLEEDLARGRARVRRERLLVGGATLAVAAVLAGGWGLVLGDGPGGDATASHGSIATDPSAGSTSAPPQPSSSAKPEPSGFGSGDPAEDLPVLRRWNSVLAENLDPTREHLEQITRETWNVQGGVGHGSRFGWRNVGEDGLGMLQLFVAESRWADEIDSPCTWGTMRCQEAAAPAGAERVRVGRDGAAVAVVVDRTDGVSVALTFDPLFGNNSLTPVSGSSLTPEALVGAALDRRLTPPR